jgi:hypothetical protein
VVAKHVLAISLTSANHIVPNESSRIFPQIAGSLTEFTWNFRELKFAIHQGKYADYNGLRITWSFLSFGKFMWNTPELGTLDLPN